MSHQIPHTVLVAAASRHGATAEISARIAQRLGERLPKDTWQIDQADTDAISSADDYDAVILGSAIYLGRWLKSARRLLENIDVAPPRGIWLFSSGPVGDDAPGSEHPESKQDLAKDLEVKDSVVFAGRIDRSALSRFERTVTRIIHVGDGDYRDWAGIDSWAIGVAHELLGTSREDSEEGAVRLS